MMHTQIEFPNSYLLTHLQDQLPVIAILVVTNAYTKPQLAYQRIYHRNDGKSLKTYK